MIKKTIKAANLKRNLPIFMTVIPAGEIGLMFLNNTNKTKQ